MYLGFAAIRFSDTTCCLGWFGLRGLRRNSLDFQALGGLVSNKLVLDGRGLFDPAVLLALGFSYSAVGRPPTLLEPGCPENAVDSRDSER